MKQIIPFKKELPFKTKVSEITSISLERDIEILKDGIVTGKFHISGDYKMNEGSINRENFSFELPFDITLDPRYDIETVNADIEDFYYDVLNEDTLKVNIDLFVEAEYLPVKEVTEELSESLEESSRESDGKLEEFSDERSDSLDEYYEKADDTSLEIMPLDSSLSSDGASKEEVIYEVEEEKEGSCDETEKELDDYVEDSIKQDFMPSAIFEDKKKEEPIQREVTATDLFSNLDDAETYTTYYVYIVKEEDTIDKIMAKYEVTKEDLESYNDISSVKPGDKIVVPKRNE